MPDQAIDPGELAHILDFYYQSFRDDVGLMTGRDLAGSQVSSTQSCDIKDLNGSALFRDYPILDRAGEKIGIVRSSAVGPQLPLIDAIFVGKLLYDERTVEATVIGQATVEYPGASFVSKGFVCYGYPRVGIRLTVTGAGAAFDVVYDAHTATRVREIRARVEAGAEAGFALAGGAGSSIDGEPFYSYAGRLPEAGGEEQYAAQWTQALDFVRVAATRTIETPRSVLGRDVFRLAEAARREDAASIESRKPAMRGITLPIQLIGQDTPVYCAVATGKMILDYIGHPELTQSAIAQAFRTGPSGTTNDNMIAGLAALTAGRWSASVDGDPTADKTAKYLAGFLPGKSGIPGHARLLRGWREYTYINPSSGRPFLTTSFYLVNDPYPTKFGQYAMEAVNKPIPDFYRNLLTLVPPTS